MTEQTTTAAPEAAPVTLPPDDTIAASFSPKWIPELAAFLLGDDESTSGPAPYRLHGLQVEPNPDGDGVILIATNAISLAYVYDRKGVTNAPFVLDLSPQFIDACRRPNVQTDAYGECLRTPGYTMPDKVQVVASKSGRPECRLAAEKLSGTGHCTVVVLSREPEPDESEKVCLYAGGPSKGDAQTIDRPILKWRDSLPKTGPVPVPKIGINGRHLEKALGFGDRMIFTFYDQKKAVHVEFEGSPEVGVWIMPFYCDTKGAS